MLCICSIKRLLSVLLACMLVGCMTMPPSSTQSPVAPRPAKWSAEEPLTLEAALDYVLENDPALRAARHRVSAAYWEAMQASLPSNPDLRLEVDPMEWALKLSATVIDLLDLGGFRQALVQVGLSREEQAALEVAQSQIALVEQVRSDFVEVRLRRELAPLIDEQVEIKRELLDLAYKQQALGAFSTLDVLRVEQQLTEGQMERDAHRLALRQAEARLGRWLNLSMLHEVELAMPERMTTAFALDTEQDTEDWLELGLLRRPELALLASQAREHEAMLGMVRLRWLRDLEAGPYMKREDSLEPGAAIAIQLPIFDHGQAQRNLYQARLAALEEEMLATQAALLLEVHDAVLRFHHARERRDKHMPALLRQTQAQYDLITEAEALGEATAIDLRQARLEVLEAQMAAIRARLAALHTEVALAAALGDRGANAPENLELVMDGSFAHGESG